MVLMLCGGNREGFYDSGFSAVLSEGFCKLARSSTASGPIGPCHDIGTVSNVA